MWAIRQPPQAPPEEGVWREGKISKPYLGWNGGLEYFYCEHCNEYHRLNPSLGGIWSWRHWRKTPNGQARLVLILLWVEYGLGAKTIPLFVVILIVLILLWVEYGLGVHFWELYHLKANVLILLWVEYGLGVPSEDGNGTVAM